MGITTTIFYPSYGGYLYDNGTVYATVQGDTSANNSPIDNGTVSTILGQLYRAAPPPNYHIYRAALFFNTSSIPDDATITSSTLSLYGDNDLSTTDFNIVVTSGGATYPHNPMEVGDYSIAHYSSTGNATFSTSGYDAAGWNVLTLNSTGLTWISKTGTTKFLLASSRDIAVSTPTGEERVTYVGWSNANCPQLSVTYTTTTTTTDYTRTLDTVKMGGKIKKLAAYKNGTIWPDYIGNAKDGLLAARSRRTAFKRNSYLRQMD